MLAESGVRAALRSGSLRISYWSFDERPVKATAVDIDDETNWATQRLDQHLFGSRLSLTVGPLVYSHTHRWKPGHSRFKSFDGVFDLRESDDRYKVRSGESLTIYCGESIRVDGTIGAFTFPRLTHATAGLVVSPSYIDPHWDGLPVLHVRNTSRKPYTIRMGEKFGTTYFFRIDGEPLPDAFRDRFIAKSHHYGHNWRNILEEDVDPYPMRKAGEPSRLSVIAGSGGLGLFVSRYWKQLSGAGVSIAFVVGLIFALGGASNRFATLESDVAALHEAIPELHEGARYVGSEIVAVPEGSSEGQAVLVLPGRVEDPIVLVSSSADAPLAVVTGSVIGNRLELAVQLSSAAPPGGLLVDVSWVVYGG